MFGCFICFFFSEKKRIPKVFQDDNIVLNILLNCEQTKSSITKQVHFQSLPTTPLEIKKKIEEDFSIPSCVQTLHYQSMTLKDSDQLQHTHFRSGDTFTVDYPAEAECEIIHRVIKCLSQLHELLKSMEEIVSFPDEERDVTMSSNFRRIESLVLEGEKDDITEALTDTLFSPWNDKKKQLNKFYFQQEGGLDLLMKVYGILVRKAWGELGIDKEIHIDLQSMCCESLCKIGDVVSVRRRIVQLEGLEIYTAALLRVKLQGDDILDTTDTYHVDFPFIALFALCL